MSVHVPLLIGQVHLCKLKTSNCPRLLDGTCFEPLGVDYYSITCKMED